MSRSLFTLDHRGLRLVGTAHAPSSRARRTGVLFVNFGYVPRDGQGGLAVSACDRLADAGFPSFRVDLPALGDSEGELPSNAHSWFQMVRAGGLAEPTLAVVAHLTERHGLDRVVLGGLCAASITAIYSCDRDRGSIGGLVLLEPELYTTDESPEGQTSPSPARKALSYWGWARVVTGESRYARFIPVPRRVLLTLLEWGRHDLPEGTNLPLVAAWQSVVRSRVPALVMTAQGKLREIFFDRVNRVAVPDYPARWIEHVRVPHTNHIFTTGGAIPRVADHIARWTSRTFGALD